MDRDRVKLTSMWSSFDHLASRVVICGGNLTPAQMRQWLAESS
jgi:hypothetical protein